MTRSKPPGPMAFTEFVVRVLSVSLTPAQRVLCRVAFDGLDPIDLPASDAPIARQIFGNVDRIPSEARHVLVAVCGARAGKSYVLVALRLLHLALTVSLESLAPGELAVALVVAPDLRLARQVLRYALGASKGCKAIASRIQAESADGFVLRREGGRSVSFECLPATRGGSAVRGRSLVGAGMDEDAFFRNEDYIVNDVEIYKAVAPRIMPGGQTVIASTPFAELGLLYELFKANHGRPRTAIAAHAPTLLLRNDVRTQSIVARERERDPDNARREFDAEFMSSGAGTFFDAGAVDRATDQGRNVPSPRRAGALVSVGADFGFRSDSSAIVVVQRVRGTYHVDQVVELRPTKEQPLVPSRVVASFASEAKAFGSDTVVADAHYRESVAEHLNASGLYLQAAPEGQTGKAETYVRARALINEGRVRLPSDPRLLRQLKEVVSSPTSGGGLSISSPRWRSGGHGDLVSALVLALFDASRKYAEPENEPTKPRFGTPEYWNWTHSAEYLKQQQDQIEAAEDAELAEQTRLEESGDWFERMRA